MPDESPVATFLFTDIEGSTRLWEEEPERMRSALARHDGIVRASVERNKGSIVKMTGDGVHAAFDDPWNAVDASVQLLEALIDPHVTEGIVLRVRCGLHTGANQRRDNDYFGSVVNRAARIMSAAHGGQILLSERVAKLVAGRLPDSVSLRDLGSVRLRDLSSPERVFQIVHPRLRAEFPVLRSLEATPNNLPQQVTSFIGREREQVEIKTMLRGTRLLTLHGVGGIGKTRLSLQVAADLMDDYPDGVWFVELAALNDERLVAQAVASVLGVKEEAGRPVVEALAKYFADRQSLLILDNCEHVVGACATLAKELLRSAANLTILASSRERLQIAGEATYPVPSLSFPGLNEAVTLAALDSCEATLLFIERAVAAQPSFARTLKSANAVTDICRRLDGIPLAIELAAARTRALSVEQIASRLSDRFRLLTHGDRAALPRQQTLRALIDWSYDLLTENERTLLRRLAVFAGGWTIDAAEAVASGNGLDVNDVVDLLTQLVEKSLVVLDAEGGRYRLLDTVRQYARDRLDESGESRYANTRHLHFYVELAERARPELVGPDQATWLGRIDAEHENLLAAHAWCEHAEQGGELDLRLVHAAKQYWLNRGLLGLRHRAQIEALSRENTNGNSLIRCRGLFNAGQVCCFMGRYVEAQGYLEDSLAIARHLCDQGRVQAVLQLLGMASMGRQDLATARTHLDEALPLARTLGNKRELAAAINGRAQLHRVQGQLDAAELLLAEFLTLARELGDREIIAIGLLNLAMVSISRGLEASAREMLLAVLTIVEEIGSKPAAQSVLEVLTGLAATRGDWECAARFFGAAEAQARRTGIHRDPADAAFLLPLIDRARNALGATAFAKAESGGQALAYNDAMREARAALAPTG